MTDDILKQAKQIEEFLVDHKALETTILDVSGDCSWADCFVIATATSLGHLRGLAREIWGKLKELGLEVNNRHKAVGDDGWELIDCGTIVIHIMSQEMRDFYSLEKLWQKLGH